MGSMRFEFSRLFGGARELRNIFSYVMHKNVRKIQLLYLTDETLVVLLCTASDDTSVNTVPYYEKRTARSAPEPPPGARCRCSVMLVGDGGSAVSQSPVLSPTAATTLPKMLVVGTTATLARSKPTHVVSCNGTSITGLSGLSWVLTMPVGLHMVISKQAAPKDSIKDENLRRDYPTQK